jgi:5-methylcytosine-specific restriction endonuclease McrA
MSKYSKHYIRAGKIPLERVLPYVGGYHRWYCGHQVNMSSGRLVLFKRKAKNLRCAKCKTDASFFAVERHKNTHTYHLNLYALQRDGSEMLMTKDHIIPICKNGKNKQRNYQVMCARCNCKKGDK